MLKREQRVAVLIFAPPLNTAFHRLHIGSGKKASTSTGNTHSTSTGKTHCTSTGKTHSTGTGNTHSTSTGNTQVIQMKSNSW